jgi:hypothetical protein|nr:prevent-host-death protein [uncultured Corynebacterium sp.]
MGSKTYCVSLGFCKILDSAQTAEGSMVIFLMGKEVAAIVPIEDVELLDELEMRADVEALRQARAEDDGTRISLEEFLAEES